MLSAEEALARILKGAEPTASETVDLIGAQNRVLAADVTATITQPPFNSSAMDGYAVLASDVAKVPATLTVVGEAQAGRGLPGALNPGEAARIFTGAPVPAAADTVVIQENTERDGDRIVVKQPAVAGANVRSAGGDFHQGEQLLASGHRLDPGAIMLAATAGHGRLSVHARPRVAILATGNELVEPGTAPGPDQVVSSNTYGLAALVARAGGEALPLGIAPDRLEEIEARIKAAQGADVLVTIGGASVGDHDLIRPALDACGMALDFWKVAIRPGKPMLFGRMGETRVLGLPGNPISCLVTARVFLVPLLHRLLGRTEPPAKIAMAVLAQELEANGARRHYLRATLAASDGGELRVTALPTQDSGFVAGLAQADALIVRPPNAPAAPAGTVVEIMPLDV
jgi:molybdopterin molybdotransferase